MQSARALCDLGLGQLSNGLRGMFDVVREARRKEFAVTCLLFEVGLLLTYVSTARLDIRPSFGAIVRNPWFVFTQAPFAARKARALIERLRAEASANDMRGFLGLIDLGEGRLFARQRDKTQARAALERIRRHLREAGVEQVPAPVAALAAEIEGACPLA